MCTSNKDYTYLWLGLFFLLAFLAIGYAIVTKPKEPKLIKEVTTIKYYTT